MNSELSIISESANFVLFVIPSMIPISGTIPMPSKVATETSPTATIELFSRSIDSIASVIATSG